MVPHSNGYTSPSAAPSGQMQTPQDTLMYSKVKTVTDLT